MPSSSFATHGGINYYHDSLGLIVAVDGSNVLVVWSLDNTLCEEWISNLEPVRMETRDD